jgi:hypothetical protein
MSPDRTIEKMEREMGFEPTASSLGIFVSIENKEQWRPWRCIQIQGNQQVLFNQPLIGGFWEGTPVLFLVLVKVPSVPSWIADL